MNYRTLEWPSRLCIEITNACNMSCAHCLYAADRAEIREISGAALEGALRAAEKADLVAVDGGGEVLISDKTITLLARIAEKAPVAFTTNGKNLSPEVLDRLPLERVTDIHVSFDGFEEGPWRLLRRGANPARIFEAVRSTAAEIERRGAATALWANIMLTTINIESLGETIKRLAAAGVRHFHLIHIIVTEARLARFSLFNAESACNKALEAARVLAGDLDVSLAAPEPFGRPREPRGAAWPYHYPCDEPFRAAFVRSNGVVSACCDPRMVMGDLCAHDFKTVWTSAAYRRLRAAVNSTDPPRICRRCIHPRYINVDLEHAPACRPQGVRR